MESKYFRLVVGRILPSKNLRHFIMIVLSKVGKVVKNLPEGKVEVNADFELEYSYGQPDSRFKQLGRKVRIAVLRKLPDETREQVLRLDNCHPDTPVWPPHMQRPGKEGRHFTLALGAASPWQALKKNFFTNIVDEVGAGQEEDFKKAIKKLPDP